MLLSFREQLGPIGDWFRGFLLPFSKESTANLVVASVSVSRQMASGIRSSGTGAVMSAALSVSIALSALLLGARKSICK